MTRKLTAAVFAALFAGSLAFLGGCKEEGGGSSSKGEGSAGVGIVDLDKVASDLGWRAKFDNNRKAYNDRLAQELVQIAKMYQKQIVDKKNSFAPKDTDQLTAQQQQMLTIMVNAYNQIMPALDRQGGERMQGYTQETFNRYREALAPIIRQVAQEKKVTIVLVPLPNNPVYTDPSADLTNAVVDAARKTPPVVTDVPMTDLSGAPADLPTTLQTPSTTQPVGGGAMSVGATTKPSTNP